MTLYAICESLTTPIRQMTAIQKKLRKDSDYRDLKEAPTDVEKKMFALRDAAEALFQSIERNEQ